MPDQRPLDWPAGLARTWVLGYNRFLFFTLALREVARNDWPAGSLQDLVTDAAAGAVEAADQLRALGYNPCLHFAGEEDALWREAVALVCAGPWRTPPAGTPVSAVLEEADRVRAAWGRFVGFARGLSERFFADVPALQSVAFRRDGLPRLLGQRPHAPAGEEFGRQPAGEAPDPAVLVGPPV